MTQTEYIERVAIQFHRYMVLVNTDEDLTYPTCFENFKASSWFQSIPPVTTEPDMVSMPRSVYNLLMQKEPEGGYSLTKPVSADIAQTEPITDEQFRAKLERRWPNDTMVGNAIVDEFVRPITKEEEKRFLSRNIKPGYAEAFITGVEWLKSELLKP